MRLKGWVLCVVFCAYGLCSQRAALAEELAGEDPCLQAQSDVPVLLALEGRCAKSAPYQYEIGRLLNQARRYADALDRLESAIMLDPLNWRAQLEYAIALEGSGDTLSAKDLIRQLIQNPAVDRESRQELQQIMARGQAALWHAPGRQTVVTLAAGYDDNLMGATRYGNLDLTLPGGSLPVVLARQDLPRGGAFIRAEFMHQHEFKRDDRASWRYVLMGSYRWSLQYKPADIGHFGVMLERGPQGMRGAYLSSQLQLIPRGGSLALWQGQIGAGWQLLTGTGAYDCRLRLGAELQMTRYPGNRLFDGRYHGGVFHYGCQEAGWKVLLKLGQDLPTDTRRPGGAQDQAVLRLSNGYRLAQGFLSTDYEHFRQRDRRGYSPVLENNAARKLQRDILRIEYRWRDWGVAPYVAMEWLEQRANIDLFSPRNRIFTVGIRHLW